MKSASWLACFFILLSSASGCEVTSEKIQHWKGTEKGPAKLRAAVLDTKIDTKLRVEAAEALVEIELLDYVLKDLATLETSDRHAVSAELAKKLIAKMQGASEQATSKLQLQTKDTLFTIRKMFDDKTKALVDGALIEWLVNDWAARSGGEHSGEKIILAVGKPAGPRLAEKVARDRKMIAAIAQLLRQVGNDRDRDLAASKIIAVAKEQNPPQEITFVALGKVGSAKARDFLLQVAQKGEAKYRAWALRALKADPDVKSVPVLSRLAGDPSQPAGVRAASFEAIEKINHSSSAEALARIISTDKGETARYRAVEGIIACCKVMGVGKLLEALPTSYTYKKADVIDLIEKDVKVLGKKVLPVLRKAIESKSWIARLIGVRLVGDLGSKPDVAGLQKMFSDRTKIKGKGWLGATVGSEAKAAVERLEKRN